MFDDTGELLPDGSAIAPHRGPAPHVPAARRPQEPPLSHSAPAAA